MKLPGGDRERDAIIAAVIVVGLAGIGAFSIFAAWALRE